MVELSGWPVRRPVLASAASVGPADRPPGQFDPRAYCLNASFLATRGPTFGGVSLDVYSRSIGPV